MDTKRHVFRHFWSFIPKNLVVSPYKSSIFSQFSKKNCASIKHTSLLGWEGSMTRGGGNDFKENIHYIKIYTPARINRYIIRITQLLTQHGARIKTYENSNLPVNIRKQQITNQVLSPFIGFWHICKMRKW